MYQPWRTFFPRFNINDVLEREWWLMYQLKLGYNDICSMPWEYVEWFYNRQIQQLVDLEQAQEKAKGNIYG